MENQKKMVYRSKDGDDRRYTAVAVLKEDGSYDVGVSVASECDQFIKRKGVLIAEGRALKRPTLRGVRFDSKKSSTQTQFVKMAREMSKNEDFSNILKNGKSLTIREISGARV